MRQKYNCQSPYKTFVIRLYIIYIRKVTDIKLAGCPL